MYRKYVFALKRVRMLSILVKDLFNQNHIKKEGFEMLYETIEEDVKTLDEICKLLADLDQDKVTKDINDSLDDLMELTKDKRS